MILATLGLRPGWIYEVAASTLGAGGPHAAPLGVFTPDGRSLRAELHKGSATLANILNNGILGLSFLPEAAMLHTVLHRLESLHFASLEGGNPVPCFLQGADAWIELRLTSTADYGRTVHLEALPGRSAIFGPVRLINRAEGLLLESLVLITRRHLLPAELIGEQLRENSRVVNKVAPGSVQAAAMRELLELAAREAR